MKAPPIDNNGTKAYICSTLIKLNTKFEQILSHQSKGQLLCHSGCGNYPEKKKRTSVWA